MSYSLSGLSLGDSYTIEPALSPRKTDYVCNISAASAPTVTITATPYDSGALVTMDDGNDHTFNSSTSSSYAWSYSYLPSAGGTVVIAIATTYDGVTKDYTLTINFTKTNG